MDTNRGGAHAPGLPTSGRESWLEVVGRQVASVQYGVVQIVIHDSRVVQIERTEKVRIDDRRVQGSS